ALTLSKHPPRNIQSLYLHINSDLAILINAKNTFKVDFRQIGRILMMSGSLVHPGPVFFAK
ncbi:hypothetical protein, partial [Acerihabitans sp.]|uniref:hypothetical protein n=1 Tax=Acerihabitans sp. TaxID=2811394 RepID=UPI002ED9DF91